MVNSSRCISCDSSGFICCWNHIGENIGFNKFSVFSLFSKSKRILKLPKSIIFFFSYFSLKQSFLTFKSQFGLFVNYIQKDVLRSFILNFCSNCFNVININAQIFPNVVRKRFIKKDTGSFSFATIPYLMYNVIVFPREFLPKLSLQPMFQKNK